MLQIVVHVINKLSTDIVTIHWHGIHQYGSFWMDGTPYLSQYPILPHQSFTYRFQADPPGTHWYHSHVASQTSDGLYGFLVVHPSNPLTPEFLISITDWFHEDGNTRHIMSPYLFDINGTGTEELIAPIEQRGFSQDGIEINSMHYQSALINGRGRWNYSSLLPLTNFSFHPGMPHYLRILGAATEFAFEVSIDNHVMMVTALDGREIHPIKCDSIIIYPGERVDVNITNPGEKGQFWLRARTLRAGHLAASTKLSNIEADDWQQEVKAVVTYSGKYDTNPNTTHKECTKENPCIVFNCPFHSYQIRANKICVHFANTTYQGHANDEKDTFGLKSKLVNEIMLNTKFGSGSSINSYRFVFPRTLPLNQMHVTDSGCGGCTQSSPSCTCTHNINIPFNATVQLVISNYSPGQDLDSFGHHPMHLHGYSFAIVAVGYPQTNAESGLLSKSNPDIVCDDPLCRHPIWRTGPPRLNLYNPPVRDTVVVPAQGYVVLRFRATNPGHWLLHCHVLSHEAEGMAVILSTATERLMEPPVDIQRYGDFQWTGAMYDDYMKETYRLIAVGPHSRDAINSKNITFQSILAYFVIIL